MARVTGGRRAVAIRAAARKAAEVMHSAQLSPACSDTRPMRYGAAALSTRPTLYTKPMAEARRAVGKSSLAITLNPLKSPVPKKPTSWSH